VSSSYFTLPPSPTLFTDRCWWPAR
jgi:hypothetical protein